MNRAIPLVVGMCAVAAFAAGCESSTPSTTTTTSAPGATSAAPSNTATGAASLKASSSPLGTIVTDGSGRTLYLFEHDTGTTSTCYNACAAEWPPATTSGTPANSGLTASLIGTTTRTDQSTQVTYNGHPVYYFSADTTAGQTNGQGVDAFGGKWYVLSPAGTAITTPGSATSSAPGGGY